MPSDDITEEAMADRTEVETNLTLARRAVGKDPETAGTYALIAIAEELTRIGAKLDRLANPKTWMKKKQR